MDIQYDNKFIELQHSRRKRRVWYWTLSALMCITVFLTTYVLIMPAITMEAETVCGKQNHSHTDECYDADGNLICLMEEHEHDMPCFAQPAAVEPEYTCGYYYEHTHTEDCYGEDGSLFCTFMEHTHSDVCLWAADLPENESSGAEGEGSEDGRPAALLSAPLRSMMPAEDFYSSDLSEFLSGAELTDVEGSPIDLHDREAEINVGENYRLFLHFDESPYTDSLKQFQYNSEGYLVYDLDQTGLQFDSARSVGGDISILCDGYPKVVGRYIFELDSETGRHVVKVQFDDVDDRGDPTPGINFIDYVQDAGFGVDVAVTVDSDEDAEKLNLNLGASWNVTLKKNKDAMLTVDKVQDGGSVPYENRYPKYDEATHTMLYKVIVKCTQGAVDNIRYRDSGIIKALDVEYALTDSGYSNYSDFVITDLNGSYVATGDSFDCLSAASGPIAKGEGYVIYYRMKIDPPGREDILKQAAVIQATIDNVIDVEYENPSDRSAPCAPVESDTTTKVTVVNLSKNGYFSGSTDAAGDKIINWIVVAGDRACSLTTPFEVKDTIGAGHSLYRDIAPVWELIDSDDHVMESGDFSSGGFSDSGNTLIFSLPHDTEYRFRVRYSTVTDNDHGGTYVNTVEVPENNWTSTAEVNVAGGIGSMTKEVTGSDSEYVYFSVTADIPHSESPFWFNFIDKLYYINSSNKIENRPEDLTVRVEFFDEFGNEVELQLPEYNPDEENTYTDEDVRYFLKTSGGRSPDDLYLWQILFYRGKTDSTNVNLSTWYFNDYDCVLTVSYRIPQKAEILFAGESPTVAGLLASGKSITNEVWFDQTYHATVKYTEPLPVTKRGHVEDYSNGTLLYEAAFTNDVIPLGETDPANYLPLCEDFKNAVFIDSFDEAMEYVPGSLMAFVYRRSENTQFCYTGSHFGINDKNPVQSPNLEAVFRYNGPAPAGNTISADWSSFVYEPQDEYGYIFGRLYRPWSLNDYFRLDTAGAHNAATLEEFANLLKNSKGENDTAVVFLYQMRIRDEYKLAVKIDLHNEACVKWDLPDFGTYVSPLAVFDLNYDSSLVKKDMEYQGGDVVSYEITLNPHGIDLTPHGTMIVKDEMCEVLSPFMASLKVYEGTPGVPEPVWGDEIDPNALYDPEMNTITWILPDNVPLKIVYNCLILGTEEGQSVLLDNSVSINGTPDSVSVNHASVTISASSSTGIGKDHYMYLQKQDDENYPLNGAVFALYGNKETHETSAPAGVKQTIVYEGETLYYYSSHTTQDDPKNPYLHGVFRLDETTDKLEDKGLFALVEIEAPTGFDVNPRPMYFYWLEKPDDAIEGVEVFKHEKDYAFVDRPLSYALPATGSSGGLVCRCLAAACFAAAAVLAAGKIRRRFLGE